MKRNNEERTLGRRQQAGAVDPASLMDFVAPMEVVDLPSRGIGYPSGHPLCGKETIEIRFMTAKDEDILTNRSLLKKGLALDRLIDNIIINKEIKSKDILVGDRNAIIIAARSSAYGHIYKTKVQCPSCNTTKKMSFDLSSADILEPEKQDVEELDNGNYMYVTEHSKIQVELRLLTGHDEAILFKVMSNKNNSAYVTSQMKLYIASVNGHSDRAVIDHFVDNVPAIESRSLRKVFSNLSANVQVKENFECENCGFEQEMEVPFNTDFFWPDR
tara:strand:- start:285 stop:1103 length:819 start_codon:yes stop_codon:yes gene_type:complete